MKKEIEFVLFNAFTRIGIDKPANMDEIVLFIEQDIKETRINSLYFKFTSEDVLIGLRRFIEQK